MGDQRPTAVVTGASSGIGAATARALAAEGFHVVLGARRLERCQEIAEEIGGTARELDVLDSGSVAAFTAAVPAARVLVNNAGGAKGFEPVLAAEEGQWRWMWEANVLGTLRLSRAFLPKLID
ncbi:MAG TPA: SDR family NAD(P)-dependent oxidoreductase, partial [Pseudonocardiaceae bacterium]|nr:SDR family NAD(P)-dependent oxidoreductase [Pseudonocardiaceae bacterium]